MRLFPVTRFKINTNLTPWEVETKLRNEMRQERLNYYDGEIKHFKFEFGYYRFRVGTLSIIYGSIIKNENGSTLSVSIRPSYLSFLFPSVVLITAFRRLPDDSIEFFLRILYSLVLIVLLVFPYKGSVKKDIDFMQGLFKNDQNCI